MKKSILLIPFLAVMLFSCSRVELKPVNAEYQYTGKIDGHDYKLRVNLYEDGRAHLQMLDEPLPSDFRLTNLYRTGYDCTYSCHSDEGFYKVVKNASSRLYCIADLSYATAIYISVDGCIYYDREYWSSYSERYVTTSGAEDAKNHKYPESKYIKVK